MAAVNNQPGDHSASTSIVNGPKTLLTPLLTISLDELKEMTRNFSNDAFIGEDRHSTVFLGVLKDGQKYAVKKLHPSKQNNVQIRTLFGILKHENVVQLHGYYLKGEDSVLAYEYAPRGSLHDILHGIKGGQGSQTTLSWMQRVKIAVSAAKGLEFLHEKAKPPVIHNNIMSSNILLFDNDVAKVGDVGLSKQSMLPYALINNQLGHDGCDAPDNKSDTFSFGVVRLELLTGRKAIDCTLPHGQQLLVIWATPRLSEDKVKQCVDPRLGGGYPPEAVAKFAAVAVQCVQFERTAGLR